VLVPAYTFFATAGAVRRAGAVPVFADVDAETGNTGEHEVRAALDREFTRAGNGYTHRKSGARLAALIVVHLFGRAADVGPLLRLAADAGATLIEDAAQAIGLSSIGARGSIGCLSFYPTKNLGGAGEGGAVTTDDAELAALLRRLRTHGALPGETLHRSCGINARLAELQAAYLNAKMERLAEWTAARARIAAAYRERLRPLAHTGRIALPPAADPPAHVWHQFVVRVPAARDRVRDDMRARGIDARVFYPVPLHLQPCFADLGYVPGALPVAEARARESLSLPCSRR
jgi:dTDP-4-amino-4,6-dideoxygalactose transaminase